MKLPKNIEVKAYQHLNATWRYMIFIDNFHGLLESKKTYSSERAAKKAGKTAIKNFIKKANQ